MKNNELQNRVERLEKALRDIKGQALVADRAWLLLRADMALKTQ